MENKNVGYLILGIAVILIVIIFLFNSALKDIVAVSCSFPDDHASSCPMYTSINKQTYLALAIIGILIVISGFLIFSKPNEKIIVKKVKEKTRKKKLNLDGLDKDEKQVINFLIQENGGMFQATLMEKLEIGKVKLTRLLDKLEAKQFIERKRRGMNNILVLKD